MSVSPTSGNPPSNSVEMSPLAKQEQAGETQKTSSSKSAYIEGAHKLKSFAKANPGKATLMVVGSIVSLPFMAFSILSALVIGPIVQKYLDDHESKEASTAKDPIKEQQVHPYTTNTQKTTNTLKKESNDSASNEIQARVQTPQDRARMGPKAEVGADEKPRKPASSESNASSKSDEWKPSNGAGVAALLSGVMG